jgi:hypothetical protein
MTKWTEKYERKNQLYLHAIELWKRVRKSSQEQLLKKLKDCIAWIHQKLVVRKEVGCRNPSLGLATKARACKVVGQEEARE